MNTDQFLKKNIVPGVAGVLSAVLVTRVEPFKSNFLFVSLAGIVVGIACALSAMAIRTVASKLR